MGLSGIEQEFTEDSETIYVEGARVHNLKNVNVQIPRNKLTVITGLSGSGKSSLAFDTIYAEGQRRYIDTFSSYARQFLGALERPDVDKITGLSPVISIEQKTTNKNPRSTVGTTTEIYDFLRLLFARAAEAYSYLSGVKMVKYTDAKLLELIIDAYEGKKAVVLAPVVKGRKGHYKELFEQIRKKGFLYARIDGQIQELRYGLKVDRYKVHDIEIVIDKLLISQKDEKRVKQSIDIAMAHGKGVIMIQEHESGDCRFFSRKLMCPETGLSYNEPAPHSFSFNSPHGACQRCNGLGTVNVIDQEKLISDSGASIKDGALTPLGKYKKNLIFCQIEAILHKHGYTMSSPVRDIDESVMQKVLYGVDEMYHFVTLPVGVSAQHFLRFEGVVDYIIAQQEFQNKKNAFQIDDLYTTAQCPECKGHRLKKESLHFKIAGKNISELAEMDISSLSTWLENVESALDKRQAAIAGEVLKEIKNRIGFLLNVGLHYLSLNRSSGSLSGGESQRIRLATQIGSQLVNVLYILDEPSIGLHQRDNVRLIKALQSLRDTGNSVVVVEHDKDMILASDWVVDVGPGAGRLGGRIVAQTTPVDLLKTDCKTAAFLNGTEVIPVPDKLRDGSGKSLILKGAEGNNLKSVDLELPLGKFICVTGVSGSGKSSLINGTLHPILNRYFYKSKKQPLKFETIAGIEHINKVIEVDQNPLGRTPRSNPATYTNIFSDIRNLFAQLPDSKIRGYKPGRFSFNVKGGRCETCKGAGLRVIEMNFLPDVFVTCEDCRGRRYNRETLEVRYKGKSISDVLDMTINQAVDFFEKVPSILNKVKTLQDVGLGYITLGQSSTTLSGGEAQRVKLASELSKKDTGNTLYILDEPTTGLHFQDIKVLLGVLNQIVDRGNTVVVIEHNLDIIKASDYIVDLGPDGGRNGGEIVATGSPTEIARNENSVTGYFLKEELGL